MFRVFKTNVFLHKEKMLRQTQLTHLSNRIEQIKQGRFLGKTLSYPFFKEIKLQEKRAYYLIYTKFNIVLFITLSNKKYQQKEIDKIKLNFKKYYTYAKKLSTL